MKVYIEEIDEWFSGAETSILIEFSSVKEMNDIANMRQKGHRRFLQSPVGTSKTKQHALLQKQSPVDRFPGGLDDLDISGIASVDDE